MEEIEKSAASVEEAIEEALAELGLSEQEARIEILQEPKSGFLGRNAQAAVVRVRPAAPAAQVEGEIRDKQGDLAADFLEGLMSAMGIPAEVELNEVQGTLYAEVWGKESGDDMGLLIGKHGHTLDALQELVRSHVQGHTADRCAVQVDVEDYRKRRTAQVVRHAREMGRKVAKSGRPETLEPMSSYERKVVHDTIAEMGGLETASEGEEPQRRVVIRPV